MSSHSTLTTLSDLTLEYIRSQQPMNLAPTLATFMSLWWTDLDLQLGLLSTKIWRETRSRSPGKFQRMMVDVISLDILLTRVTMAPMTGPPALDMPPSVSTLPEDCRRASSTPLESELKTRLVLLMPLLESILRPNLHMILQVPPDNHSLTPALNPVPLS